MTRTKTLGSGLLMLFFVCCSCQSKPLEQTPAPEANSAKVTNAPEPTRIVELLVKTSLAPRRSSAIESGLFLDSAVKKCMRSEFKDGTEPFTVSIQGRLGRRGEILNPLVITQKETLKTCLMKRFKTLEIGPGQSGTFKVKVERAGPLDTPAKSSKPIFLDLDETKDAIKKQQ